MPQPFHVAITTVCLLGSLLLGGCATPWEARPPSIAVAGRATLVLHPEVRAGASRRAQAVVSPFTAADVDHVRVQLFRVTSEGEAEIPGEQDPLTVRIAGDQLDRPIILSQLHPQTRYRIRAGAYKAADEFPEHLISLDASVDVEVGNDDRPTVSTLRIPLRDVPFNGKATLPGLELVPGGYVPDGVETISLPMSEWVQASMTPTWLGLEGDRMSERLAEPDGLADAHLRITVDMPAATTIRYVSLVPLDAEGYYLDDPYWTTWEYHGYPQDRLLGVSYQGTQLNTAFVPRLGSFSGPVEFDLYGYEASDFPPGRTFEISLGLANGTTLWDLFTVPGQEEGNADE